MAEATMNAKVKQEAAQFVRDTVVEDHLKQRWGIEVPPMEWVDLDDVDEKKSLDNQARYVPVDPKLVDTYAKAFKEGNLFHALVTLQTKKHVILGGNHRNLALKQLNRRGFMAYVLRTDDVRVAELLPKTLNTLTGNRPVFHELLEGAVCAVITYGMTLKEASVVFGVSEAAISTSLSARNCESRLMKCGAPCDFPKESLTSLNAVDNDNALSYMANVAKKASLSCTEMKDFVRAIKAKRTESAMMGEISDWAEKLGVREGEPIPPREMRRLPLRTAFLSLITRLEKLSKKRTLRAIQFDKVAEINEMKERCENVGKWLRDLAKRS